MILFSLKGLYSDRRPVTRNPERALEISTPGFPRAGVSGYVRIGAAIEVLEYESMLELKGGGAERATFKRREKVCYLQNNVIVYQDQAWRDGEILVTCRCSLGIPVDVYRAGYKTSLAVNID